MGLCLYWTKTVSVGLEAERVRAVGLKGRAGWAGLGLPLVGGCVELCLGPFRKRKEITKLTY